MANRSVPKEKARFVEAASLLPLAGEGGERSEPDEGLKSPRPPLADASATLSRKRERVCTNRSAGLAAALALATLALSHAALAQAPAPEDPWPGLAADLFQNRAIIEEQGFVSLQAPTRAEDAAIVPMTIKVDEPVTRVRKATLVIDQNPMPMAASFTLGENAGVASIATRVRVNSYTNVHVVAETQDGALHAIVKFVKASGGCSAPANKDMDEAMKNLGQMKYREFKTEAPGLREAQIMIRHPNNSGMQMDQLTHLYIPAHYIDKVEVRQGGELIFAMEGGISLSEDPNFRFTYKPNGAKALTVEAHDSRGNVFKSEWPIADAS